MFLNTFENKVVFPNGENSSVEVIEQSFTTLVTGVTREVSMEVQTCSGLNHRLN